MNGDIPNVSIIMPVYNSERFVASAIQSVLDQKYTDFELIIVDDGSSDGSGEICRNYEQTDNRVRYIHKENGGVCSARNLGISLVRGRYLTFIDNDDIYYDNYLSKLMEKITSDGSDLVKCGRINVTITDEQKEKKKKKCTFKNCDYTYRDFICNYLSLKRSGILSSVWNGIYDVRIIKENGLVFREDIRHGNEDIIFNLEYYRCCKKISVIEDVLYCHYYRLKHSTSVKFYKDQVTFQLKAINMEIEMVKQYCDSETVQLLQLDGIRNCFRILSQHKLFSDKKELIGEICSNLDMDCLYKNGIVKNGSISSEGKIDLVLIKYKLYFIYFLGRKIRSKLNL